MSDDEQDENSIRRVRVYQMNANGAWDERGTGYVELRQYTAGEAFEGLGFRVTSETDGSVVIECKVQMGDIYSRQQGTLIVWNEPSTNEDLALSFQEEDGCDSVWVQICELQGRDPNRDVDELNFLDDAGSISLPAVSLNNLTEIAELVTDVPLGRRERLEQAVLAEDYIPKLLELYQTAAADKNNDALPLLFVIFRGLVMLNRPALFEVLFADEHLLDVIGALENDPMLAVPVKHRDYLTKVAVFKEIVPFSDPELLSKVHQSFRVQYLKDVVLARYLDDGTFATLNSLAFFRNVEIVTSLANNRDFLQDLFKRLKKATKVDTRREHMAFLKELLNLAKNLQADVKRQLYQTMLELGLADVLSTSLQSPDVKTRLVSTEILHGMMIHESSMIRQFMLSQREPYPFLTGVVRRSVTDTDTGVLGSLAEILRIMLDPMMLMNAQERDEFLNVFYESFMPILIEPLLEAERDEPFARQPPIKSVLQNQVCELLTFCVQSHQYRIKYFIIGNNLAAKVLKLTRKRDKFLVLSAVRWFRTFLGQKDDFYAQYIIKNELFEPIVDCYRRNGNATNLLNSALLDIFEFVRKPEMNQLVVHIADMYSDQIKSFGDIDTFTSLLLRAEQHREHIQTHGPFPNRYADDAGDGWHGNGSSTRSRRRAAFDQSTDELAEECYLHSIDDDDANNNDDEPMGLGHRSNDNNTNNNNNNHNNNNISAVNGVDATAANAPPAGDDGDDDDDDDDDDAMLEHAYTAGTNGSGRRREQGLDDPDDRDDAGADFPTPRAPRHLRGSDDDDDDDDDDDSGGGSDRVFPGTPRPPAGIIGMRTAYPVPGSPPPLGARIGPRIIDADFGAVSGGPVLVASSPESPPPSSASFRKPVSPTSPSSPLAAFAAGSKRALGAVAAARGSRASPKRRERPAGGSDGDDNDDDSGSRQGSAAESLSVSPPAKRARLADPAVPPEASPPSLSPS